MSAKRITYKNSGVDVAGGERFVKEIKRMVRTTHRLGCLGDIGSFGGFFQLPKKYKNPILVSSSDGVGTKLKLAFGANIHDTVGIDLVAMSVNDCVCSGAEPLFFQDYIATGKLDKRALISVMKGIVKGCKAAGCALTGGETAEMPDFYKAGEYDLSGFCVGAVDKKDIIDGSTIRKGDKIIGLASSGLHSNGFSLVRKVFSKNELKKRAAELLMPTKIYVKPILALLSACNKGGKNIKGIAHITGGAFHGKIPRIIPGGLSAHICKNSWPIPQLFHEIKERAHLHPREMFGTLNMGIGMVVVASPKIVGKALSVLHQHKIVSWEIGEIAKGKKNVVL